MDQVDNLLNETVANNATRVFTPEAGIASAALFFMAIIPIYIGCHKSIKAVAESIKPESTEVTAFQTKEAAMFPIYASLTLFGIFVVFKFIAAQYINNLLAVYSFFLGVQTVFSLTRYAPFNSYQYVYIFIFRPLAKFLPKSLAKTEYTLTLTEREIGGENDKGEDYYKVITIQLVSFR